MKFGVFVPQGWRMDLIELADPVEQWEAMTAVARAADAGPWDSIWLFDHFHTVPEPARESVFEAWTATAALARDTSRVNIGQLVGCNGYRNPALYAKIAATVDVASHGRLYAGLGAGWAEDEWTAYGYPWASLKDRMGSFRESVELIHRLWTEEDVVFHGKYHSVDKPYVEPRRKPPLWIGGGGEQVTLKLVAQYGDACNFGTGQVDVIKHKLAVLRKHCDAIGRDYDEIVKSTSLNLFPSTPATTRPPPPPRPAAGSRSTSSGRSARAAPRWRRRTSCPRRRSASSLSSWRRPGSSTSSPISPVSPTTTNHCSGSRRT